MIDTNTVDSKPATHAELFYGAWKSGDKNADQLLLEYRAAEAVR